jgi:hypothetical protein
VAQFYENPDKYSPVQSTKTVAMNDKKVPTYLPLYSPPPYAPPSNGRNSTRHQTYTNAVIEAANVRARDEVCFTSSYELAELILTSVGLARDAEHATASSVDVSYLQQRH